MGRVSSAVGTLGVRLDLLQVDPAVVPDPSSESMEILPHPFYQLLADGQPQAETNRDSA